jgi:hypothetical protein
MKKVCYSCKRLKGIVHTDELDRGYCDKCFVPRDLIYAMNFMALTVPFKVGDRVECRTGGQLYDGIGVVEEVSTDLKNGGTWVHPSFLVRFEEKAYETVPETLWYTESCLTKVSEKVSADE